MPMKLGGGGLPAIIVLAAFLLLSGGGCGLGDLGAIGPDGRPGDLAEQRRVDGVPNLRRPERTKGLLDGLVLTPLLTLTATAAPLILAGLAGFGHRDVG